MIQLPDIIISGGQTGVDRAALDVALKHKISCGGWCPRGRWAENGPIPKKYPLQETTSVNTEERTKMNVKNSDGTLILIAGKGHEDYQEIKGVRTHFSDCEVVKNYFYS